MLDECIQNFSEFQYCVECVAGEMQENFEKDARFYKATRNYRKLWKKASLSQGLLCRIAKYGQ